MEVNRMTTTAVNTSNRPHGDRQTEPVFDEASPDDTAASQNQSSDPGLEPLGDDVDDDNHDGDHNEEYRRIPTIADAGRWSTVQVLSVNWLLLLWNALTLPSIGIIYTVVNAQGIRAHMPVFGIRLYKIPLPGFSMLRDYEGTYRLDFAHVFAFILLLTVWCLWIVIVRGLLYGHDEVADPRFHPTRYFTLVYSLAAIIIPGDAIIFYAGLSDRVDSLWAGPNAFVPIIATVIYMAILAFIGMVHVHLAAKHKAAIADIT